MSLTKRWIEEQLLLGNDVLNQTTDYEWYYYNNLKKINDLYEYEELNDRDDTNPVGTVDDILSD